MMLPTPCNSATVTNRPVPQLTFENTPEEDDENMSTKDCHNNITELKPCPNPHHDSSSLPQDSLNPDFHSDPPSSMSDSPFRGPRAMGRQHPSSSQLEPSFSPYQLPVGLPAGYSQPTPFPSQADYSEPTSCPSQAEIYCHFTPFPSQAEVHCRPTPFPSQNEASWIQPSATRYGLCYPRSLPSCPTPADYPRNPGESIYPAEKSLSLPGPYSPSMSSLEPPHSLHSNPDSLLPYCCSPPGVPCCAQCPFNCFNMGPAPRHSHHPGHRCLFPYSPMFPDNCIQPPRDQFPSPQVKPKTHPFSAPLSLEQRKVFVTYEADSDKHVNQIIQFVALLRHNGFDTHIDMFEQQFRSISKIDFMERYLSEKEYLIIIIISPKYYETVTASPISLENDERTLNTVYIHKQLQNEFIQNGSKNFRFIPVLFPGAKKCHVPTWLQNTQVYSWPRDRDDVLRRLMRVEKYNPPPVGKLPTIVSIPI
ncbi:hypothetical protein UPYG_G00040690 [Umbra pygmaea]|uniref:E3 ubiquitin ligase TRAF3IP2 n=1 Tax=Umbra pygmaea TaxID=75934 RepID=A0ABD0XPZ7_UMBPY